MDTKKGVDAEEQSVKSLIVQNGGYFHEKVEQDVTHLVSHRAEGSKYKIALKNNLTIVTSAWIFASVMYSQVPNPTGFDPSKFAPSQVSSSDHFESEDANHENVKKERQDDFLPMQDIDAALPDDNDFSLTSDEERVWNIRWKDLMDPGLCKEQEDLVSLICSGKNVFFTGSAGTGKSTVLKHAVHRLRRMGKKVRVVAPTGKAALAIDGWTTWTFAGWTPGHHKQPVNKLMRGAHGKTVWRRLNDVDILIFDEIGMVENHHFERLNWLLKAARGKYLEAFGGLQIVAAGDFLQLPPVKSGEHCLACGRETSLNKEHTQRDCPQECTLEKCITCGKLIISGEESSQYTCQGRCKGPKRLLIRDGIFLDDDKWAFCSNAWAEAKFANFQLTTIHRQSQEDFVSILQKVRFGLLQSREFSIIDFTNLLSPWEKLHRVFHVAWMIHEKVFLLFRQESEAHGYSCFDHFEHNPNHGHLKAKKNHYMSQRNVLTANSDHRYESHLEVKVGMQVILLANLNQQAGLVNGAQGVVTGFQLHRERTAQSETHDKTGQFRQHKPEPGTKIESPNKAEVQSVALPQITGQYQELRSENIHGFVKLQEALKRVRCWRK